MTCERARLAVSSQADGESAGDSAALETHLAACGPCRQFAMACLGATSELADLVRPLRLRPARPVPAELMALLHTAPTARSRRRGVAGLGSRHRWDVRRALSWAAAAVPAGAFAVVLPVAISHPPTIVPSHVLTPCTIHLEANHARPGG